MGIGRAVHEGLAKEYVHILLSYARKDGNYLETEGLQRGLLWGIGRLAQARPELVKEGVTRLMPYLRSPDAGVRGLAAWIMGLLEVEEAHSELEALTKDEAELRMVFKCTVNVVRVKDLAKKALGQFTKRPF